MAAPDRQGRRQLLELAPDELLRRARAVRDGAHGTRVTYSPKVFIPLTMLCRDRCGYCTFAKAPARLDAPYLTPEQVLQIARQGADAGCHEALFTLGERPGGSLSGGPRLAGVARLRLDHRLSDGDVPPGARRDRVAAPRQRRRSFSRGAGSAAPGQRQPGDDDRDPAGRIWPPTGAPRTRRPSGGWPPSTPPAELAIPFTTGILVGIGEDRADRVEALEAIAASHARHGHVQEVIVQNFVPKPGTAMHRSPRLPSRRVCGRHRPGPTHPAARGARAGPAQSVGRLRGAARRRHR